MNNKFEISQAVGFGINYTGDRANHAGRGAITAAYSTDCGNKFDVTVEDGRVMRSLSESMFGAADSRERFLLVGPIHGAPYLAQLAAAVAMRAASASAAVVTAEQVRTEQAAKLADCGIKLMKHYVTNGKVKARCWYSSGQVYASPAEAKKGIDAKMRKCVTIYAKDYGRELGEVFGPLYINHTDTQSDYFDKGSVRFFEGDPLYSDAVARARQ